MRNLAARAEEFQAAAVELGKVLELAGASLSAVRVRPESWGESGYLLNIIAASEEAATVLNRPTVQLAIREGFRRKFGEAPQLHVFTPAEWEEWNEWYGLAKPGRRRPPETSPRKADAPEGRSRPIYAKSEMRCPGARGVPKSQQQPARRAPLWVVPDLPRSGGQTRVE